MACHDVTESLSTDVRHLKVDIQTGLVMGGLGGITVTVTRTDPKISQVVTIEGDDLRRKALLFMMLFSSDSEC